MSKYKTKRSYATLADLVVSDDGVNAKCLLKLIGTTEQVIVTVPSRILQTEIANMTWRVQKSFGVYRVIARTRASTPSGYSTLYLSRLITDCPNGMFVDHHDHNTLNNSDDNLRVCTPSQNNHNLIGPRSHNKSTGVLGVIKTGSAIPRYRAKIVHHGERFFGEVRDTMQEALADRIALEKKLAGEFAPIRKQRKLKG